MTALTTASLAPDIDELLEIAERDHFELVDGVLKEKPGIGAESAIVTSILSRRLSGFVADHRLGVMLSEAASYQCFPHRPKGVRRPDLSFIRKGRLTRSMLHGHLKIPPDLAIEIVSPNDLATDIQERVDDFRKVDTPLIWVLYPSAGEAVVYRSDGSVTLVTAGGQLDGEGVIPGFRCPLAELLVEPDVNA